MYQVQKDCVAARGDCHKCKSSPHRWGWTSLIRCGCQVRFTKDVISRLGDPKAKRKTHSDRMRDARADAYEPKTEELDRTTERILAARRDYFATHQEG